jgi:hypothetical protein
MKVAMDLDTPFLEAAQIAELSHTDIVTIHTWTTRGFADPYHTRRARRGGGRPRSYSRRDALRFFLMARLHRQFRTPLPQGLRICQSVFGEENFDPEKAGYLVVEEGASASGDARWFDDVGKLTKHLDQEPLGLVVNVRRILNEITSGILGLK